MRGFILSKENHDINNTIPSDLKIVCSNKPRRRHEYL